MSKYHSMLDNLCSLRAHVQGKLRNKVRIIQFAWTKLIVRDRIKGLNVGAIPQPGVAREPLSAPLSGVVVSGLPCFFPIRFRL